jgi:hypothetical protein
MKIYPLSKTLFSGYLELQMMHKVQKPSDSGCCTPSSKPFRIHLRPSFYFRGGWDNEKLLFTYRGTNLTPSKCKLKNVGAICSNTFWNYYTLNSRLSGIMVGMEITINRKPG